MNELLTLAIVPTALWLILVFLRVRGVTLVLSILVGKLLADELSPKLYGSFGGLHDMRQMQLALLLLPVALTIILTRGKTPKSKTLFNGLALLFGSLSIILLALPYLDISSKINDTGQNIIDSYQSYILCAAGGVALVLAWLPDLKREKKHKK